MATGRKPKEDATPETDEEPEVSKPKGYNQETGEFVQ